MIEWAFFSDSGMFNIHVIINVIHYINILKNKIHMIISLDAWNSCPKYLVGKYYLDGSRTDTSIKLLWEKSSHCSEMT